VAIRAGFAYDKFDKETGFNTLQPDKVETISVPVGVAYFHPSGFFAAAGLTYVDQDVEQLPGSFSQGGHDSFVVVDVGIGYRFPKRLGIASLQVNNLFDEGFRFQDDSFREFSDEPTIGPYIPERTILGRVTLNF
jgi:outer membrane receptor protein involved in Fe transport